MRPTTGVRPRATSRRRVRQPRGHPDLLRFWRDRR